MVGETRVPTPNVAGQTQINAEGTIVSVGLTVGIVTHRHHQSAAGRVISQNPTEGTMVALGSPVDLDVSKGPDDMISKIIPVSPPPTKGSISTPGMVNLFQFTVESQGSFTIETKAEPHTLDTVMSLFGPNSQTTLLHENDDIDGSRNRNSRITANLAPGTYHVKIRYFHSNQRGDYTIFVKANE